MKMVKLKTGAEVPDPLLLSTLTAMSMLLSANVLTGGSMAAIELVAMARNPGHAPFGRTGNDLYRLGLIDHAHRMHGHVRNIVLAATEGDGLDIRWVSPLGPEE